MSAPSPEPRVVPLDPIREPVEGQTLTFSRHRVWKRDTQGYGYTWAYSVMLHDGRTGWQQGHGYPTKAAALAAAQEAYQAEVAAEPERVTYWNVFGPTGVGRLGRFDTLDEALAAAPEGASVEARRV